jgi:diphthamide biosynthesis protein 3
MGRSQYEWGPNQLTCGTLPYNKNIAKNKFCFVCLNTRILLVETMSVYEDVELSDMRFDAEQMMYFYTCPCGDLFEITLEELHDGEDIALCPSCSLKVRVLYEESDLPAIASLEGATREPDAIKPQSLVLEGGKTDPSESASALQALATSDDE